MGTKNVSSPSLLNNSLLKNFQTRCCYFIKCQFIYTSVIYFEVKFHCHKREGKKMQSSSHFASFAID